MYFNIYFTLTKALIKKNIGRFFILVCICALGAGFFCGMNHVPICMKDSLNEMLNANNVYDYKLTKDNGISSDDASKIDGTASKQIDTVSNYNDKKHVTRVQQILTSDVNKLEIIDGHYPNNNNECLTIQSSIEDNALYVGDKIKFNDKEYSVSGIVNSPEYFNFASVGLTKIANGLLENVVFINEDAFSNLLPYYCIYCKGEPNNIDDKYTIYYAEDNDSVDSFSADTERIESLSKVFPVIFYLIAIVVTITVVSRKINEDRRSLGISLSLGIKRRLLLFEYLTFTILASFLGSIIGCILFTAFLPKIFMIVYSGIYNIQVGSITFNLTTIILTTSITVLIVVFTTFICVVNTIYASPNSLLLPKIQKSANKIFLEKFAIWEKISTIWKATIRSLVIFPMRFVTSIINIACCMLLFICSLDLYYASSAMIEKQVNNVTLDNYSIYLQSNKSDEIDELLRQDKNTEYYSRIADNVIRVSLDNDEKFYCEAIWTDNYDNLHNLRPMLDTSTNSTITPSDSNVVITQRLSEVAKLKVGDNISVTLDNNNYRNFKIDAITENYIYNYVYFGKQAYTELLNSEPKINTFYVKTNDIDSLNEKIEKKDNDILGKTSEGIYSYYKELIQSITYISIIFIVITCIMSFTVLYSLTTIAICERSNELSVLKVLGYKKRTITTYVHRDTLFHVLIGIPIGIICGKYFSVIVLESVEGFSILFDKTINTEMILQCVGILLVFIIVSIFVLALQTDRIKMTETVKGE